VRVGDDQLHPVEAAVLEVAEELGPERLVLRVAHIDAEDLTVAVSTQPGGDHHGLGDDLAGLAHVDVGRVQPHVHERLMIQPAGAQRGDVGVDALADPATPTTWRCRCRSRAP
jgi:hypothetical protein